STLMAWYRFFTHLAREGRMTVTMDGGNCWPHSAARWRRGRSRRARNKRIPPKDWLASPTSRPVSLSVEGHGCSILFVGHSREIVARINVSCPAKEEFIESFKSARSKWINDPSKADPHGKALRSRDWNQLKMVRERSDPVGNQVILGKPNIRVT